MSDISVVFTSCGRFDLLRKTLNSFIKYNTHPIEKYLVVDNSTNPDTITNLQDIFKDLPNTTFIINETNIGQVASIDKAYSLVETKYIFHCEDDWEFYDYGFIEESKEILGSNDFIVNINIRKRNDGPKGSFHPIEGPFTTESKKIYYLYQLSYLGVWHGFSWNPGLRRLKDYNKIKPYKQYVNEQGVNEKMKSYGFRAACLSKQYCFHIGENSITPKSNS